MTAATPGQAMAAPEDQTPPEYRLLGWAARIIAEAPGMQAGEWDTAVRNWLGAYAELTATPAAQEPHAADGDGKDREANGLDSWDFDGEAQEPRAADELAALRSGILSLAADLDHGAAVDDRAAADCGNHSARQLLEERAEVSRVYAVALRKLLEDAQPQANPALPVTTATQENQ